VPVCNAFFKQFFVHYVDLLYKTCHGLSLDIVVGFFCFGQVLLEIHYSASISMSCMDLIDMYCAMSNEAIVVLHCATIVQSFLSVAEAIL